MSGTMFGRGANLGLMSFDQKVTYLTGNGLVRSVVFNAGHLAAPNGSDIAFYFNSTGTNAVIDSTKKASGYDSVKFTVPSLSGAGESGQLTANFSADRLTQFGAGQTFFVQWMCKLDRYLFEHTFATTSGSGGFKLAIITAGDPPTTCTTSSTGTCALSHYNAVVMQNQYQRKMIGIYNYDSVGGTPNWEETYGGDFKLQNAMPSPYCLYTNLPSLTGCSKFADGLTGSNQETGWMTITQEYALGSLSGSNFVNSHVNVWVSWDGAIADKLYSWTTDLRATDGTGTFGKIWLLPYQTNKDATEVHTQTYMWVQNLIVGSGAVPSTILRTA